MINKYRSDDYLNFDINSRWKLQNAKIKLLFARGLNDSSSLLGELDDAIIRCILENIDKILLLKLMRDPEDVHLVLTLKPPLSSKVTALREQFENLIEKNTKEAGKKYSRPPSATHRGGGKKRHKSKRKKSKRKKSKRKKSKRRKNTRRK